MLAVALAAAIVGQGRTLTVFAAASLKEAFTQIARSYEAAHPGLTVRLNFAGSQTLAAQINQGAPTDVFASAAEKNLDDIRFDKGSRRIFVRNTLEIAVRRGLGGVRTARDLASVRVLVVADPAVPVGQYTEGFFGKAARAYGAGWLAQVRSHIVSREQDVKAVLAKVVLGEADAGIVYVSDVASARGQVSGIAIPKSLNEGVSYPVAIPAGSGNVLEAKHFIKFLFSPASQRALESAGFVSPLEPVSAITVTVHGRTVRLGLPLAAKYRKATIQAVDKQKHRASYTGVLVSGLPGVSASSTATFVGADGYSQTISIAVLKARKAVLVRAWDGNYRLIVPGLKPNVWVNWLRRIDLR